MGETTGAKTYPKSGTSNPCGSHGLERGDDGTDGEAVRPPLRRGSERRCRSLGWPEISPGLTTPSRWVSAVLAVPKKSVESSKRPGLKRSPPRNPPSGRNGQERVSRN